MKQKFGAVVLNVNGVGVILHGHHRHWYYPDWMYWKHIRHNPHREEHIMVKVTVGHNVAMSIGYVDTNGNPMITPPTPDSAPAWSNAPSDPSVDKLVSNADGSAELDALAAGSDTVSVSVVVGGATFSATLAVEVDAAPQVLGGVVINSVVS